MALENDTGQGKHRPVDHTRHHRENGWDYRGRAIYHFTLVVEGRYPLFGTLVGENAEKAFVKLNNFGHRVYRMLDGLSQFYKGKGVALKMLAQKVMPDHIHLVIQVLEPLPKSIGAVVRGFKSGCTKVYKQEYFGGGEGLCGGYVIILDNIRIVEAGSTQGIDDVENNSVAIYPNPANSIINVEGEGIITVQLLDMNGRTVITRDNRGMVDISGLANGIYMVRVITENGVSTQKIVKK